MIDQIEFSNYQGHLYSTLDLSGGLNIITGRSHSGKSSMMRGVEWALENRPRGDKFRRDFMPKADSVVVSMSFIEGTWISREKNPHKKLNCYTSSEHPDPFVALRTDVPDEIRDVTRLVDANIQSQGDKYFLLGKTPGQVATELNKVVGLQIIDDKKKLAKRKVSDFSSRLKVLDSQISETEKELEAPQFQDIDELSNLSIKINNSLDEFDRRKSEVASVERVVSGISIQEEKVERLTDFISMSDQLLPIKNKILTFIEKENSIIKVIDAVAYIDSWEAEIDVINRVLSVEGDLKLIKGKIEIASALRSNISRVETLYRSIRKAELSKEQVLQSLTEYEFLRNELLLKEKLAEERLNYCSKCGADKKHWRKER